MGSNYMFMKELTRIICVEITEVGGWKILPKDRTRKICGSFAHPLSLAACLRADMWVWFSIGKDKDSKKKAEWLSNPINCQVLHHFGFHPLFNRCIQCPVSITNSSSFKIFKNFFLPVNCGSENLPYVSSFKWCNIYICTYLKCMYILYKSFSPFETVIG